MNDIINKYIIWCFLLLSTIFYIIFRSGEIEFLNYYLYTLGALDFYIIFVLAFHLKKNNWKIAKKKTVGKLVFILILFLFLMAKFASLQWIIDSVSWGLLFLAGYYIKTENNEFVSDKTIKISFLLMIPFLIELIFLRLSTGDPDGSIIYPVYYVITYLPFLALLSSKWSKSFFIIASIILVIMTSKRTGTLSMLFSLFISLCVQKLYVEGNTVRKYLNNLLKVVLIISIICILSNYIITKFEIPIFSRLEQLAIDTTANGRKDIWDSVINAYKSGSLINKIIGNGYHATQRKINLQSRGVMAHNDLLEYIYDYGIIGLFLLIYFIKKMFENIKILWKSKSQLLTPYLYSILVTIPLMMFSYMFVQSVIINYFALFWGIVSGQIERNYTNESNIL